MAGKSKSAYIRLFESIDKQEVYDEEKIKKHLSDPALGKQKLAVTKHYLYEAIMKSLKAYYFKPSVDSQLKEMIRNAEILFYIKNRQEDSREILYKALEMAEKYERFLVQLEIYTFLYTVDIALHKNKEEYAETTAKSYENQKLVMAQLENFIELRVMESKLRAVQGNELFSHRQQEELVKEVLSHKDITEKNLLSYKANFYFNAVVSKASADTFLDHEKSYACNKEIIRYMESDQDKLDEDISNYFLSHYHLMKDQLYLKKYDEMKQTIKKVRDVFYINGPEFIQLCAYSATAAIELAYCAQTLQLQEGLGIIKTIEKELIPVSDKLNRLHRVEVFFGIAVVYLLADDYTKARSWINKIVIDTAPVRADLKAFSRILNLIATYEAGDYGYLEHLVAVYKRNPVNGADFSECEKAVLNFMNKSISVSSDKKMEAELLKLKMALEKSKENNYEKRVYYFYDLVSWVNRKIEKT